MSKRIFDLLVVMVCLPLWGPVLLVTAGWVALRLGRPLFFVQERPGYQGRLFKLIKFRTMTRERDANGHTLPDARRLMSFGNRLRSLSLDELPELINVVQGDMTLVGPRPLLKEYLDLYTPEQARRHEVLPGITGWAQVNGRNAITWEEKFRLDVWYVDHRSFWLDIRVLAMTLWKVVIRQGISAPGEATMPKFQGTNQAS